MPCFHPLTGYRSKELSDKGKRQIVFNKADGFQDLPVTLPCGQCVGCRLERSRQWAIRCMHEASLYDENCFITLTFSEAGLALRCRDRGHDDTYGLDVRDFQLFMKRLRKRVGAVRFYHCGEYGENFGRPHYHACIFGFDFPDKYYWRKSPQGHRIYRSSLLEELWPYGNCEIGSVTFESAAYVARYIMKKVNGDFAEDHYRIIDPETGEIFDRKPEYTTMSRRPGIGRGWLVKFTTDVYPSDFIVMNGATMRPPKYYDGQYEIMSPKELEKIKARRKKSMRKFVDNNTTDRLEVREQVLEARISSLKKSIL